jgi:acetyl esterase/lipase
MSWLMTIGVTAWVWTRPPHAPARECIPKEIKILRDRVYRTVGPYRAKLDVYLPSTLGDSQFDGKGRPAVLALHGGSWIGGSKTEYGNQVARLAEHGYVVVAADYRLARPGSASWPEVWEDAQAAVRWIHRHAQEIGVDPGRIAALGSSAGGHLAALLGTSGRETGLDGASCRVQAVVSLYGPTDLFDLTSRRHLAHEPVCLLLDGSHGERQAASPIAHVTSGDAPMLLIHGSDDSWVPPEQSCRMAEALDRAGVQNRLIVVPGARHGFGLVVQFPQFRDLLPEILAFLEIVWQERRKGFILPSFPSGRGSSALRF